MNQANTNPWGPFDIQYYLGYSLRLDFIALQYQEMYA